MSKDITQDELFEKLIYNKNTGNFIWAYSSGTSKAGTVAGSTGEDGYIRISINSKKYMAHRLAWLYMYGVNTILTIDHINHIRDDNRIENLREVSQQDNCKNQSIPKSNTSGVVGVFWNNQRNKWTSQMKLHGKSIHFGYFDNFDDAVSARKAGELQHEFHDNHGKQIVYEYQWLSFTNKIPHIVGEGRFHTECELFKFPDYIKIEETKRERK